MVSQLDSWVNGYWTQGRRFWCAAIPGASSTGDSILVRLGFCWLELLAKNKNDRSGGDFDGLSSVAAIADSCLTGINYRCHFHLQIAILKQVFEIQKIFMFPVLMRETPIVIIYNIYSTYFCAHIFSYYGLLQLNTAFALAKTADT